jgi:NitT/TauT family transport system permease protein
VTELATAGSRRRSGPSLPPLAGVSGSAVEALNVLIALGVLFVAWELAGRMAGFRFLPPFSTVLARLGEMIGSGLILDALAMSLLNLVIGFAIAVVGGITLGIAMGLDERVEMALSPFVYALFTAPSIVFAPVFFSIFGLGRASIVAVIVTYSIFVIIINTTAAVQASSASLDEMGRSFCVNRRQRISKIVLPGAVPLILAGVRIGAGSAVKGMINGEMFIAVVGLGAVVSAAGRSLDSATLLAIVVVIAIVAFVVMWLVEAVDHRMTAWLPAHAR